MMGYRQGGSKLLPGGGGAPRSDWRVIKDLLPYLLELLGYDAPTDKVIGL